MYILALKCFGGSEKDISSFFGCQSLGLIQKVQKFGQYLTALSVVQRTLIKCLGILDNHSLVKVSKHTQFT